MTTPRSRAEPTTPTVDDKTLLVPQEQVDCVIVIGLFKKPIIGSLKSMMAEIRHLKNRHDVIFFCRGGPIWIKFRRLVQNDMSTAVMWSKSKPDSNMADVLANSMACHPRATYHIAGCCHLPRRSFLVAIAKVL